MVKNTIASVRQLLLEHPNYGRDAKEDYGGFSRVTVSTHEGLPIMSVQADSAYKLGAAWPRAHGCLHESEFLGCSNSPMTNHTAPPNKNQTQGTGILRNVTNRVNPITMDTSGEGRSVAAA